MNLPHSFGAQLFRDGHVLMGRCTAGQTKRWVNLIQHQQHGTSTTSDLPTRLEGGEGEPVRAHARREKIT